MRFSKKGDTLAAHGVLFLIFRIMSFGGPSPTYGHESLVVPTSIFVDAYRFLLPKRWFIVDIRKVKNEIFEESSEI